MILFFVQPVMTTSSFLEEIYEGLVNTNRRKSPWTESHLDFLKNIIINVIYNDADLNRTIIETTHSAEFNCMTASQQYLDCAD